MPRTVREPQIVDAAEAVFAERGFYSASMDEIADRAGVATRTMYAYFDSKPALYIACMERASVRVLEVIAGAARAAPRLDVRLLHAERAFFEWVDQNRGAWSVLYGQSARGEPFAEALNGIRRRNALVIIDLIIDAAVTLGIVPPERADAEQVAYVLLGAGESLADWWLDHPEVPRETVARRVATLGGHAVADLLRDQPPAP